MTTGTTSTLLSRDTSDERTGNVGEYHNHPYVQYLRAAMQREGLNQERLAERSTVSKTTISLILKGEQAPRTITNPIHQAFADALACPMYRFVEEAGYTLFGGSDLPDARVVTQANSIDFPQIRDLSDIANLDQDQFLHLFRILQRRAQSQS